MSWKTFITGRGLLVIVSASLVCAALYSPFSFSARLRHKIKRVIFATEKNLSELRGHKSQLISIKGETGLAGAQVQALDSKSGWASLCDPEGRFVLPDVVWYPNASYELIISTDDIKGRKIRIVAPSTFPTDGILDIGSLSLDDTAEVDQEQLPGTNLISFQRYDFQNRDYYRKLYEDLTDGKISHEENVDAVNKFIAERLDYNETQWDLGSPRRVIDHGSQYCGHLSFAMATVLAVGYSTRIVNLWDGSDPPNTHVVVEVFYKGEWHLYDPTYGVTFKDETGRVVSYKELRLNPGLISEETFSDFRQRYPKVSFDRMRDMYRSGYHHYYSLTFKCSQFCHAWWAYPDDQNYVTSGGRIWLAAAGICPGTHVTYHIRKADSDNDEMTFSSRGTGNSVCVLNQEQSPPINLAQGSYKVFVDLKDGNIRASNDGTPSMITDWKLSVNLYVK